VTTRPIWRRTVAALAGTIAAVLAVLAVANIGGWRARIVARLLRINNPPAVVSPSPTFEPRVPTGFTIAIFASAFQTPRWLAVAPDGDVFVSDSTAGQVIVLKKAERPDGDPERPVFADHLRLPFGIAFHDRYVYVANTNEVVRFPYDPRTSKRLGGPEHVLDLPGLGYNQHWTRSVVFSGDGRHLFVSVGSQSNVSIESDARRAAILIADPDGSHVRVYASGLRNAVGLAIDPSTGDLWSTVNERDDLDDDTPPDYFTHIVDGGFYGWPYSYIGQHVDNRVAARPDLVDRAIVPDVLLGAHVAPLQAVFYEGHQFPEAYRNGVFLAEHGSWNRRVRQGYDIVFIPFRNGHPAGKPTTFLSGLVPDAREPSVYGRPVGVAVLPDGSLLVSDDGRKVIWRITFG
jgi:glucose/arabinose dehydrogenase